MDRPWAGAFVRPEEEKLLVRVGITTVSCLQSDQDLAVYNISSEMLFRGNNSASLEEI